ncbi:MAG: hypothetical protein FWD27_06950, partial [Coriobacteriia bacterium]|nr:hypothetical protein [Coriobacteriia bacterium]
MANHHKKSFMAKGTKSSILRKALSYFLAFMLAVTMIPLASFGAPEGDIIDLQDLLDQGYTIAEEGGAPEGQDAPAFEFDDLVANPGNLIYDLPHYIFPPEAPVIEIPQFEIPQFDMPEMPTPAPTEFSPIMPLNATTVTDWATFFTAWNDPTVSHIILSQSITRGNTGTGDRLGDLNRDLKISGASAGIVLSFGTETVAGNNFSLANRNAAAAPTSFTLENLILHMPGVAATNAISGGTAANTVNWTINLHNVSAQGAPARALIAVPGAKVNFSGSVIWDSTNNNVQMVAASLNVANDAQVSIKKNGAANIITLTSTMQVGERAVVSLEGSAGNLACVGLTLANSAKMYVVNTADAVIDCGPLTIGDNAEMHVTKNGINNILNAGTAGAIIVGQNSILNLTGTAGNVVSGSLTLKDGAKMTSVQTGDSIINCGPLTIGNNAEMHVTKNGAGNIINAGTGAIIVGEDSLLKLTGTAGNVVSGSLTVKKGAKVDSNNTGDATINCTTLILEENAEMTVKKSGTGHAIALNSRLEVGEGAKLDIDGGGGNSIAVNFSASAQVSASFAANSSLKIANTNQGLFLGFPTDGAANYARVTFGPNSTSDISVLNEAIRGSEVFFQEGAVSNMTASNSANAAGTVVNMRTGANHCIFDARDGAQVTITADGGNCVDIGTATALSSNFYAINGAKVQLTGNGTQGDNNNAVVTALGVRGGFTVESGSEFKIDSIRPTGAYPALVQEINGGNFFVDGEGSKLILSQKSSFSEYTAVLRFRLVGNQTFKVSNDGEVEVTKHPYPNQIGALRSVASAAIRFGPGINNNFIVESGGKVKIYNGGMSNAAGDNYDTGPIAIGGNDALEYNANGFGFHISGSGNTGPSAISIIADRGAAVDAGGAGGGSVYIGPGTVFIAEGRTGSANVNYPIFNATGDNFDFEMDSPLFYDFVNKRQGTGGTGVTGPDGGPVFNLGTRANWDSVNSDVAVWLMGRNPWDKNPERSYTLINYYLTKNGTAQTAWAITANSDPEFRDWWNDAPANRMGNYTRISGNNARPEIKEALPATNADQFVRWTGTVPEGFNFDGRAFWDDEIYALIKVVKADGTEFTTVAAMSKSINEERIYLEEEVEEPLEGVLRLEKILSEPTNPDLFLETGDSYTVLEYWRGKPEPAANDPQFLKRHMATSTSNLGPIVVTDIVPPLPATTITPNPFYANQRNLSGTWEEALNDNPPVTVSAKLKRGEAVQDIPGTGTVNTDGTWTYAIPSSFELQEGDEIFIIFADDTSPVNNVEPIVDTPLHDMMVLAAASIMVQAVNYDIEGMSKVIGMESSTGAITAPQITGPAELLALIEAKGYLLVPSKTERDVEVKATDFPYGSEAEPGYYYVDVKIKDIDFEKRFFVEVLPGEVITSEDGYHLNYIPIKEQKDFAWAQAVTDQELMDEAQVNAFKIIEFSNGGSIKEPKDVEYVSRTFPMDNTNSDYFTARIVEKPEVSANIPVNLSIKGSISGTLFVDADRNGFFSTGDTVLAGKTVLLYKSNDLTTSVGEAITTADGTYRFTVEVGSYVVKAPAHEGHGYTTLIVDGRTPDTIYSDVNNNGLSTTQVINLEDSGANLNKVVNAGYAVPEPNPDPDAFSKDLVAVNGEATNGPIYDSTADLTYAIKYVMPSNTAGYNQMTLLDIMDPGLVLKGGNTANISVSAVAADGTTPIAISGTPAYAPGTDDLAGTMVASFALDENTDFSALAGATITMAIIANIEKVGNAWPTTVTNKARLLVNNSSTPLVPDEPNEESNTGLIKGFAFKDDNRDGVFNAEEIGIAGITVVLKQWNGTEYVAYTPGADDVAVTTGTGAFKFEVPAGIYRLEFPTPHSGMGITTSAPNAGASGIVEGIVIELGTAAEQTRTISAGYNKPGDNDDDDFIQKILQSFSKKVDNGSGTFVDNRSVTNINEELLYKISFVIPEPSPGITPFAGFYALELKDIMQEGLAFANVASDSWNWQVKVGTTVVASGVATGSTVDYTFSPDEIEQYLATAPVGTEVALMVKANMVQVDGQWPTTLTNNGYLTIPAGEEDFAAEEELVLDALGQEPVITFLKKPLVVEQTPNSSYIMTKDDLCAFLTVTDAEDYPTWMSDADGRAQDLYKNMVVTAFNEAGQPTTINTMNIGVYRVEYKATDSTGNTTTEYRAVVVDDGRYIVDPDDGENGIIIGARNFVIKQAAVTENVTHIRNL